MYLARVDKEHIPSPTLQKHNEHTKKIEEKNFGHHEESCPKS
jgi:hypothetical protein